MIVREVGNSSSAGVGRTVILDQSNLAVFHQVDFQMGRVWDYSIAYYNGQKEIPGGKFAFSKYIDSTTRFGVFDFATKTESLLPVGESLFQLPNGDILEKSSRIESSVKTTFKNSRDGLEEQTVFIQPGGETLVGLITRRDT